MPAAIFPVPTSLTSRRPSAVEVKLPVAMIDPRRGKLELTPTDSQTQSTSSRVATRAGDCERRCATGLSHVKNRGLLLNMRELVELPLAAPGARFARFSPGFGAAEIGIPERPGAALAGALFVDRALTAFVVEEHTIAVLVFHQATPDPDLPNVLFLERRWLHLEPLGKCIDFGLIHPHIAGSACATITAAGAFEFQAVLVPRLGGSSFFFGGLGHDESSLNKKKLTRGVDRRLCNRHECKLNFLSCRRPART